MTQLSHHIRRIGWLLLLGIPLCLWGQQDRPVPPSQRFIKQGPSDSVRQARPKRSRPLPTPIKASPPDSLAADTDSVASDSAPSRVRILNADLLTFQKQEGIAVQKLIGDVRLAQDSTFFFCDSAYLYEKDNRLKAFNRVRIMMPGDVLLTSDRLVYEGNTRIAEVYDNITLTDGGSELTTDRLTYHREEEYGYYQGGGKLVDDSTVLTSQKGYYYPNQDRAFFRGDVELKHPDYDLYTDTLGYDTKTKVAQFLTFTTIVNEDGVIETSEGSYDTQHAKIDLFQRSQVNDSSYTLIADTLLYSDDGSLGLGLGDVVVIQEDSSLELRGQYGRFNRQTDESFITGDAVAIQRMDGDTLYMFADTLFSLKDSIFTDLTLQRQEEVAALIQYMRDSLASDTVNIDSLLPPIVPPEDSALAATFDSLAAVQAATRELARTLALDSLGLSGKPLGPPTQAVYAQRFDTTVKRLFIGYYNVRFFMNDMQGRADSMVYYYDDSLLYLYQDPILWADENQLTGDTITVWMKNEQADSMQVNGNGFMASKEDTVGFNQLKGRDMRIKFRDNELYRLRMVGNTESIYFIKEDQDSTVADSTPPFYQGMNKALSNEMVLYFEDQEVIRIVFLSNPEGTFYPFYEIIFQPNRLDGFVWRPEERPARPTWLLPAKPPVDSLSLPPVIAPPSEDKTLPLPESGPTFPVEDPSEALRNEEAEK